MEYVPVLACDVVAGYVMYWHGEWWTVKNNYCHPQSCYAKMSLTNDDFAREHGRNATMATCKTIGKNQMVLILTEEAVSTDFIEKARAASKCLNTALYELSNILELPERVRVGDSMVFIDRKVVEGAARRNITAIVTELSNYCKKV